MPPVRFVKKKWLRTVVASTAIPSIGKSFIPSSVVMIMYMALAMIAVQNQDSIIISTFVIILFIFFHICTLCYYKEEIWKI